MSPSDDREPQVFRAHASLVWLSRIIAPFLLLIVAVLLFLGVYFFADPEWRGDVSAGVSAVLLLASGGCLLYAMRHTVPILWNGRHFDIAVDDEGVWPASKRRDKALLAWAEVGSVHFRSGWQRLDLRDARGKCLLYIHSSLHGFDDLCQAVAKRYNAEDPELPLTLAHRRPVKHYIIGFLLLGGGITVAAVAWFTGDWYKAIPAAFLLYPGIQIVLTIPLQLEINEYGLVARTAREETVICELDVIERVELRVFVPGSFSSQAFVRLEIYVRDETEPVWLENLDVNEIAAYRALLDILRLRDAAQDRELGDAADKTAT